jgi:hypothetical protein
LLCLFGPRRVIFTLSPLLGAGLGKGMIFFG